ncbi:hypothetical protein [Pseudomonas alkylphenolica]|uniref:hypothetical protein n=1 Tax=Pseudomonas alkylphenolica TaxID=237609 RepID=UPI000FEBE958|nr:hypothetical protein [Pseudomonas alkylphenolica]
MGVEFVVINAVFMLALVLSFITQSRLARQQTTLANELLALRGLCKTPDYMALLIAVIFIALIVLAIVSRALAGNPFVWLAYGLVLAMLIAMVVLCVTDKGLVGELKKYKAVGGVVLGALSFAIPYLAAPMADATISEFTTLEASLFPRAQHVFVLIMSVLLWPLALSILGLLAILPLWIRAQAQGGGLARKTRLNYMSAIERRVEQRKSLLSELRWLAVIVALSFSALAVPVVVSKLVSAHSFNSFLKGALVSSSFHLPPQACGLSSQVPESARVVQIRLRLASVAIPESDDDYRFERLACDVPGIGRLTVTDN